jgi:phosphoglucosamine mutase
MLEFGTDGIRGKASEFPFTQKPLFKLGIAIARWSIKKYQTKTPRIIIGHDTRLSCGQIKENLLMGLSALPIKLTDGGVLPTPAVLRIMQQEKIFDCGIVISASHNPYTDNGIKLFDAKTGKISKEDEDAIVKFFYEEKISPLEDAQEKYIKTVLPHFKSNFLAGKKIVLDCAHGATCKVAPKIFEQLGATVIALSISPNGKNINEQCGALHPELVKSAVIEQKANIGFAFDGDGDRVIAVNKNGIIKNGDDILALLIEHSEIKNKKTVVGTIMTNHGLENHLKEKKINLLRTRVGDKYVAGKLVDENLTLGGESSGHIIISTYMNTGDGIFVALKVLESIVLNNNWEMKTFKKVPQFLKNIPVSQKKDLAQQPYANIIKEEESKLIDGRVVVRYSGTENLLRVMVEDQEEFYAEKIATDLSEKLQKALET